MNCEGCGRPLQPGENRYCPNCRNKGDFIGKTVSIVGGAIVAIGATIFAAILGRKGKPR